MINESRRQEKGPFKGTRYWLNLSSANTRARADRENSIELIQKAWTYLISEAPNPSWCNTQAKNKADLP